MYDQPYAMVQSRLWNIGICFVLVEDLRKNGKKKENIQAALTLPAARDLFVKTVGRVVIIVVPAGKHIYDKTLKKSLRLFAFYKVAYNLSYSVNFEKSVLFCEYCAKSVLFCVICHK
jgi:hypothetical protein